MELTRQQKSKPSQVVPPARNIGIKEELRFRILEVDENFGILEVVKKCCEDGKIFPQHNIQAANFN